MTDPGSTWPAVKAAYCDRWQTLADLAGVVIGYSEPLTAVDVDGDTGRRESAWWEDNAAPQGAQPVELGLPVRIDEELQAYVRVQVLGQDSSDDRRMVEARCAELVGALVDDLGANPRVAEPSGWVDVLARSNGVEWLGFPMNGSAQQSGALARIGVLIEGTRC